MKIKQILCAFMALTIFASCSSTTTITSTDQDAKIYVDGEFKGKGSVTHTDTKTYGSTTSVRIAKDGCEDRNYYFQRNEEFDAGACAGGVFALVPFLWIMKYKPVHSYEYECKKTK